VLADRCINCHRVADIGRRTTRGQPIAATAQRPPFHQALIEKNCLACHSDHPRPMLTRATARSFDHSLLAIDMRGRCEACHIAPGDLQHQGITQACAQCHKTSGWRPSTFDHTRYFALEGEHRTACVTCHTGQNYRRYTCYGCHEHQQADIIARHREEGIRNIDNCVRCHRSSEGEPGEHGEGRGRERDD
jgi:hypothetical protein